MKNSEIQIRDPFVLPVKSEGKYYLYGTTDPDAASVGIGFDVYVGEDLESWAGPFPAFRPDETFWADRNFWSPEVHEYRGQYYMFASFKKDGICRGTQILVADKPIGPFQPHSDGPVTPVEWECLDGTLYEDDQGQPWIVYCHEWVQVQDGEICAQKLTPDLKAATGAPILLFKASEAPWTHYYVTQNPEDQSNYVTDGPYFFALADGELSMLWSSFIAGNTYAIGIAKSTSGTIHGPWIHQPDPIYSNDAGHGMLFETFDRIKMLTIHSPNQTPHERAVFHEVSDDQLSVNEYNNK